MNKKVSIGFIAAAACMVMGNAQAAPVSAAFYQGPIQLSDNSGDLLINNAGGSSTLDVGDRLLGVFDIGTVESLTGAGTRNLGVSPYDELSGIFDIQVSAMATGGQAFGGGTCNNSYCWAFSPVASATFNSDITNLGATGPGVLPTGAMVVTYDHATPQYTRTGSLVNSINSVTQGGSQFYVSGFTGAGGTAAAGQYWNANAQTNDLSVIHNITPPTAGGSFNNALNILVDNSGLNVLQTQCTNPFTLTNGIVDQCGSGSLLGTGGVNTGYDTFDNVDVVMTIPEPGSLFLMGAGLLALGVAAGAGRRRSSTTASA